MKLKLILLLVLGVFTSCIKADEDAISVSQPDFERGKIAATLNVQGTIRDYLIHIPESYTGDETVPLLFVFHGLGGSMEGSYENYKFYEIAENQNFIVVHPDALSNRWNAFSSDNNADINFISALISELQEVYNIDANRIYSCGMSNGGYFSFLLACELSDKLAGIVSVTGLMYPEVYTSCQPSRAIPILQIHGTNDNIVDYENVENVLNFWIENNNSNTTPTIINIPNTVILDRSSVEQYIYSNGDDNTEIHHFKIIGGRHQWPGHRGNMDINASEEIWRFLKQFDLNGKIQ